MLPLKEKQMRQVTCGSSFTGRGPLRAGGWHSLQNRAWNPWHREQAFGPPGLPTQPSLLTIWTFAGNMLSCVLLGFAGAPQAPGLGHACLPGPP